MKMDTGLVIRSVSAQIENIIDGLEVYKQGYEKVASQLCSTGLQIVHEIIIQTKSKLTGDSAAFASLINEEDKRTLS